MGFRGGGAGGKYQARGQAGRGQAHGIRALTLSVPMWRRRHIPDRQVRLNNTARGVDLTFAARLAASSSSECQIRNSTASYICQRSFDLAFAKVPAAKGCEC